MLEKVMLFVDARHGIYCPQVFCQSLDWNAVRLLDGNVDDVKECSEGPDAIEYWEAWNALQDATIEYIETGQRFRIFQDGDVWLIDETAELGVDHQLWSDDD